MGVNKFEKIELSISDDSGLLALVNTEKYKSYIDANWSLEQLHEHFAEQSKANFIFIWETACEGFHKVVVLSEATNKRAQKDVDGLIEVTSGYVYLTNYEDLSMSAQFDDEKLPNAHNSDLIIQIPNGIYDVTVHHLTHHDEGFKHPDRMSFELVLIAKS